MATNIVQGAGNGLVIQVTAGAAYVSGQMIHIGDQGLFGVCLEDIASGASGSVMVPGGVIISHSVKGDNGSSSTAVAIGDKVSWDSANDTFFDVTAANPTVGYALEAVSSGATTTIDVLFVNANLDK